MTNSLTTTTAGFDLSPRTFEQAIQFSKYMAASDLVPKDYRHKPENCFIAMQWGAEIGLKPMQALQNIAAINGRPALWGDAMIALVRSSPLCEYIIETDDGQTATCRVKRRGEEEQSRTFSVADAKQAGLAGKQGPWTTNPRRMRQLRARAFALRDVFPDVLRGMPMAEEVMDIPADGHAPATRVAPVAQKPEHYPAADFDKNVGAWAQVVAAGKLTLDGVLAKVQTKGELTTDQLATLHSEIAVLQRNVTDVEPKPEATYADIADRMHKAQSIEALHEAADLIGVVADGQQREELTTIYMNRQEALEGVEA